MANDSLTVQILKQILKIENVGGLHAATDPHQESQHRQKIAHYIRRGDPIHMVLPAFPAKSPNPRKTRGHLPDYGEVLALTRLNDLCNSIAKIYPSGAQVTICSDGHVFSDVVRVVDANVDAYVDAINDIIRENAFANLSTFNLKDIFRDDGKYDYDCMRMQLDKEFSESVETVRRRVKNETEMRTTFNGIHRFMFEDYAAFHPELSKNAVRERSKILAYHVIRRSNAWSRLVEERFPHAVRLSIHPQLAGSNKIGVCLVPSTDLWRTPWHSVAAFDGHDYMLMPRIQAEAAGAMLSYAHDKYPLYVLQPAQRIAL